MAFHVWHSRFPGPSCKSGVRVTMSSPPRLQVLAAQGTRAQGTEHSMYLGMHATPAAPAQWPVSPLLPPSVSPSPPPIVSVRCDQPQCRSVVMPGPFSLLGRPQTCACLSFRPLGNFRILLLCIVLRVVRSSPSSPLSRWPVHHYPRWGTSSLPRAIPGLPFNLLGLTR